VIVRFVKKLNAARLSKLLKRFEKIRIPAFTLFNEDACDAVRNLELFPLSFETVYLLQNDVVGGKVALSGGSFKDMSVQGLVKVEVEEVALLHLWSSQEAGVEVSI